MAEVTASASMGVKLKFFSEFENVNPHFSLSIKRDVPDDWTDEQIAVYGEELMGVARERVQAKINSDIKTAKGDKIRLKKDNS